MSTITREKYNYFLNQAKKYAPAGYVSIGKGDSHNYLNRYFLKSEINAGPDPTQNGLDGSLYHMDYCLEKSVWDSYFACNEKQIGRFTAELVGEGKPPAPPEGYHYKNRGFGWKAKWVIYFVKCFQLKAWDGNKKIACQANGLEDRLYLEVVKNNMTAAPAKKEYSIKEQIEYARTFVGKKIASRILNGQPGLAGKIEVFTEIPKGWRGDSDLIRQIVNNQGCMTALVGVWEGGVTLFYPVHPELYVPELYVEKIKVNGFEAEDKGDYYKFGCEEISKELLRATKKLIESSNSYAENQKRVQSVKIGAGEFTLDILNKLNL